MTDKKIIWVIRNGHKEKAQLDINEKTCSILLTFQDGWAKNYTDLNIYNCLGNIIKEHSDVNFLCKGAKRNVRPSSMSAQMTSGIMAYENTLGEPASRQNLVNIFDFDDQDIINDPQLQKDFFSAWMKSIQID
ncbi:hypothetical protein M1D68_03240 [Pseudomonas sp. R4-84]